MIDGYVVGAYVASPAHAVWNPAQEAELFEALAADSRVGALELPWLGRLHPHDDAWLCGHLPARFRAVLTDIPHVMGRLASDPGYGLASSDADGRARALDQAARLRDDVHRLNDTTGRAAVAFVELHSSPRQTASVDAFVRSLEAVQAWDWDGALVVIEHCDAAVPEQAAQKGFLSLEDELQALHGTPFGMSLNWGRSAIELRDADRVVEHVARVQAAGRLSGLIFSGASDRTGHLGAAWTDAHHPLRQDDRHPWGDPTSLLTEERMRAAVAAAGPQAWLGVKLGWAHASGSVADRSAMLHAAIDACDRARRASAA